MKIRYTHVAYPPQGVDTVKVYELNDIQKQYGLSMDEIQVLFTPLDGVWEVSKPKSAKTDKSE